MKNKDNQTIVIQLLLITALASLLMLASCSSSSAQITHRAFIPPDYVEPSAKPQTAKQAVYISPYYREINTLEDMIEWVSEDMWSGAMTKEIGDLYILNIQQVIKALQTHPVLGKPTRPKPHDCK